MASPEQKIFNRVVKSRRSHERKVLDRRCQIGGKRQEIPKSIIVELMTRKIQFSKKAI